MVHVDAASVWHLSVAPHYPVQEPLGWAAQHGARQALDQVGGEALGPQPLLEAVCAAQGAFQAAGPGLQQGGADALVSPVVSVLGGQPGDIDEPPALGIIGVVARIAEQVAGGQLISSLKNFLQMDVPMQALHLSSPRKVRPKL